jgi:hypothetical protein
MNLPLLVIKSFNKFCESTPKYFSIILSLSFCIFLYRFSFLIKFYKLRITHISNLLTFFTQNIGHYFNLIFYIEQF